MKKSSLVAMIMGTIGGILSALGMCMCLLPEWGVFREGIVMGSIGLATLLAMVVVWRRMEHKAPVKLHAKTILAALIGISGSILLGVGMCLSMVWNFMVPGIAIGIVGIVALVALVPLIRGLKFD